jgi:signal transduction histidine kinase
VRDLSLHILDLIENSLRAGATIIAVTVAADETTDRLTIGVEDNGTGLPVPPETATNPFYTTKSGKRVGLGLALLKGAAERADGTVVIEPSALGGTAVKMQMIHSHIDRSPMGDLAATLSSVVCTNPGVDFRLLLRRGAEERSVRSLELAREAPGDAIALAQRVAEIVKKAQQNLTL